MVNWRQLLIALVFALALPCLWTDKVGGHALLDHCDPKVGETVSGSPVSVRLWFDRDLEPLSSAVSVQDARRNRVDKKNGRVNPSNAKLLEVGVPPLPAGTYRVIWNVVTRDGHHTTGDYTFVIK